VNVDGSWNALLARYQWVRPALAALGVIPARQSEVPWPRVVYHDVRRPLPWENASACAVYASHLLEHLYPDEAARLLHEALRVLAPGGIVRIMVPDLELLARDYLAGLDKAADDPLMPLKTPADRFLDDTNLSAPAAPSGPLPHRLYAALTQFHRHKWMYDRLSLCAMLRAAGFEGVAVARRHESRIPGIEAVENNEGLIAEGMRPTPAVL
jgi:SAM-dependent methyltransferase